MGEERTHRLVGYAGRRGHFTNGLLWPFSEDRSRDGDSLKTVYIMLY